MKEKREEDENYHPSFPSDQEEQIKKITVILDRFVFFFSFSYFLTFYFFPPFFFVFYFLFSLILFHTTLPPSLCLPSLPHPKKEMKKGVFLSSFSSPSSSLLDLVVGVDVSQQPSIEDIVYVVLVATHTNPALFETTEAMVQTIPTKKK